MVSKAEIGGPSLIPRCAPCGSEVASFLPAFRMATSTRFRLGDAQARAPDKFVRRMGDDYPGAIDLPEF
jgi:hypothetical protein